MKETDVTKMYKLTYTHIHNVIATTIMDKNPKTRHACLDNGDWCPEQYKEEFEKN